MLLGLQGAQIAVRLSPAIAAIVREQRARRADDGMLLATSAVNADHLLMLNVWQADLSLL